MGWASQYIDKLKKGETVQFRPHGNSMQGRISSGQLVTVEPVDLQNVRPGDVVLCKVRGAQYLHLVGAVRGKQFRIENNHGHINGWVSANSIYGKCTKVED